jgi:hypothetical protein
MKKFIIMVFITGCLVSNIFAQSNTENTQYAVENLLIMPKSGMEEKFEAAVQAHNKKFHPDGPYVARLRKIEYGPNAGWYVWIFGPTVYGSLDTRPTKENGHSLDWSTTIDPLVEEYGPVSFWNFNPGLSFGLDLQKKSKYQEVWAIDLKPKQYYRFKELVGKLKKAYESEGKTAFLVFENNLHAKNGPDVAITWSFDKFGDWQTDPGPKSTYEKLFGAGSWQSGMDEWMDMINGYDSEIRSAVE